MRPVKSGGCEAMLQVGTNSTHAVTNAPLLRKRTQNLVKRLLPPTLLAGLRVVAELGPVSNSGYKRIASVVRAWRRAGIKPILGPRIRHVVFVCHGNIMRSPVAEAMLKRELEARRATGLVVSSAGMHAIDGRRADPRAQRVAPEFGVSVSQHTAQLVTPSLVDLSDLIVVMDIENAAEFLLRYPHASEKLFLLRQFSGHSRGPGRDIPDPYPGDEDYMRQCCGMLRECVEGLAAELLAGQRMPVSS